MLVNAIGAFDETHHEFPKNVDDLFPVVANDVGSLRLHNIITYVHPQTYPLTP